MKVYAVITNRWMPDAAFDVFWCMSLEAAERKFEEDCEEGSGVYPVITELQEFDTETGKTEVIRTFDSQD